MTTPRLPAPLSPWAEVLAVLDVEVASALGPMIRQLDRLLERRVAADGPHGDLDGYGGLGRRGDPSRLVMSEWSLAHEFPLEFLRRAASADLLYLAPNFVTDRDTGRVTVLVDCGPDQLGAGRLVQLAVLIVLARRARGQGVELEMGVLGDPVGTWFAGDPETLLRTWLTSRRDHRATRSDVDAWTSTLQNEDGCWILTGPVAGAELAERRRVVVSRECAWDADGATAVDVLLDGDRIRLSLPRTAPAVRALRGAGFVSSGSQGLDPAGMTWPCFPGAPPRLLGRGAGVDELVAVTIPFDGRQGARPRRHRFAGPVVAAAFIGRRLVALVLIDDELRVSVVGKRLALVDRIAVAALDVDLDPDGVDADTDLASAPMVFDAGALVVRLGTRWWRLVPHEEPTELPLRGVLPTEVPDVPTMVWSSDEGLCAPPALVPRAAVDVVVGPGGRTAWLESGDEWRIAPDDVRVVVPPDESVRALVQLDGSSALLTWSSAGLILRLRWSGGMRVLTTWSGSVRPPAVHPTRPWIALQRDDGRIEVADIATNSLLLTVPGTR